MEDLDRSVSGPKQRRLRRLNGRLQACDPCRRQKVACDHGQPVCQKCIRKKKESLCTYTISAHSVPAFEAAPSQPSATPQRYSSPVAYTALNQIPPSSETSTDLQTPSHTPGSACGSSSRASGYLGHTSSTAVVAEARQNLPNGGQDHPPQPATRTFTTGLKVSRSAVDRGLAILRHLPTVEKAVIVDNQHVLLHEWIHRIATAINTSLYDTNAFGTYLGERRDDVDLRDMVYTLCVNTAQPVDDAREGEDWVAQFTGRNTRWESIGILLIFWEFARRDLPSDRNKSSEDSEAWREYLNSCLELCDTFSKGNVLLLNLYNRRAALESMTTGDASLRTAKAHAETVACLSFLGYHVESAQQPYVPTLASELKRAICAIVYGSDKSFSTFTGRPALMSSKSITTPLPLDIATNHLFGPQNHLEFIAATTLDQRGWNKDGAMFSATCLRARAVVKRFRAEILAIALGNCDEHESSIDALLEISHRQTTAMAEFPISLSTRVEDEIASYPEIHSVTIFIHLMNSCEALQNKFFLNRLLLKKGYNAYSDLLLVSYRMVSHTVALWANFERFAAMKTRFQWILMAFGAPAGVILCKELQKPTLPGGRHPEDKEVTRSSIIQKLSLLVGFLDWVDPTAPNAELCSDCKMVIKLVLDQTLNGSAGSGPEAAPSMSDQFEFEFPNGLDFNFDLMDSFDWLSTGVR